MTTLTRRTALVSLAAGLAASAGCRRRVGASERLTELERRLGGRLGVAVLDTRSGARLAQRSDERFAMCSTFKWALAAAVLARVDQEKLALDQPVSFGRADLLDYAPVTRAHVDEGKLTVESLCAASVEVSDNTAANLLLGQIGGPAGLTAWMRSVGDTTTRLDRDEPMLNTNLAGDPRDTTTPAAMVELMRRVLVEDALKPASRERLIGWLRRCSTGGERLRAGLPASWSAGDKTGSGEGAWNDVAIAWPPGRPPVLIAAYTDARGATAPVASGVLADVGRLAASEMG